MEIFLLAFAVVDDVDHDLVLEVHVGQGCGAAGRSSIEVVPVGAASFVGLRSWINLFLGVASSCCGCGRLSRLVLHLLVSTSVRTAIELSAGRLAPILLLQLLRVIGLLFESI